jgi:hypothetical protein
MALHGVEVVLRSLGPEFEGDIVVMCQSGTWDKSRSSMVSAAFSEIAASRGPHRTSGNRVVVVVTDLGPDIISLRAYIASRLSSEGLVTKACA